MPTKEKLTELVTLSPKSSFKDLKAYEVLTESDLGGRYQPNTLLNNTLTIVKPIDRISPVPAAQEIKSKPLDLSAIVRSLFRESEAVGGGGGSYTLIEGFCINCGACGALLMQVVRVGQQCPKCRTYRKH